MGRALTQLSQQQNNCFNTSFLARILQYQQVESLYQLNLHPYQHKPFFHNHIGGRADPIEAL